MLVFNLKKEWYDKIKSGNKTVEYRYYTDYWAKRVSNALDKYYSITDYENDHPLHIPCRFIKGYTKTYLTGYVYDIQIAHKCDTDLRTDSTSSNASVFCFHFKLDKQGEINEDL